jgi:hypothetical protein
MSTKRALLIGINYTATPSVRLNGCINDIVNVRNTLIDAYGYADSNISLLRDDDSARQPTKINILNALTNIVRVSAPGDTLWIHYSGHGTQIRSITGDEFDGLTECIVPSDFSRSGFIDDNAIFNIIAQSKCQLILCFDSCHSGTVCDLQYSTNYSNGSLSYITNNSKKVANPNIIMLSGCRDAQTSADAYNNYSKQGVGAFTITLLETLRSNDHNISIVNLYKSLCANLKMAGFPQVPVLSSSVISPSYQFMKTYANSLAAVSLKTGQIVAKSSNGYKYVKDLIDIMPIGSTDGESIKPRIDASLFPAYKTSAKFNMKRLF